MNRLLVTNAQTRIILVKQHLLNFFLRETSAEHSNYFKSRKIKDFNSFAISTDTGKQATVMGDWKILHPTLRMSMEYYIVDAWAERFFQDDSPFFCRWNS